LASLQHELITTFPQPASSTYRKPAAPTDCREFITWLAEVPRQALDLLLMRAHTPLQTPRRKRTFKGWKDPEARSAKLRAAANRLVEYEGEMIPALEKARRIAGVKLNLKGLHHHFIDGTCFQLGME
jgi:hypothetical protein